MTKKYIFFVFILLMIFQKINAQIAIDVTEQTIKVAALTEEVIYFGFADGDQIIFNFNEVNGKEIKEVEIIEFPSASKFSDYKTNKIENKVVNVNSKAVYKFRFYNSSLAGRVCKIKIQRIPKSDEYKNFNSSIKWIKEQDTVWNSYTKDILVGYDTLKKSITKKVLVKEEKYEEMIIEKSQRVHSETNSNGNKTSVFFSLPNNFENNYESKKVVSWAFWIGVDEASNKAWQENRKLLLGLGSSLSKAYFSPLGAYAFGELSNLILPTIGEDVSYSLVDEYNKNLFFSNVTYKGYDHGKGRGGFKKFTEGTILQGTYFIVMSNDNVMQGIDANIKVSVIIEHKKFEDKQFIEEIVTPKFEKQIVKEPIINTREFPATFDYKK